MGKAKRAAAWLLVAVVAAAAVLLALTLYTPLPLRVASRLLEGTLKEAGVSVSFQESRGSLLSGLELDGVSVRSKEGWSARARHLYCKVSLLSVLLGRPVVKDLVVEAPEVVLPPPAAAEARAGKAGTGGETALPRFSVRKFRIVDASVGLASPGGKEGPFESWHVVSLEGSAYGRPARVRVKAKVGGAEASRPGLLPPVDLDGQCTWERGRGAQVELAASAAGSSVKVKGRAADPREKSLLFKGTVEAHALDLRLLEPFWPSAPERVASAKADVRVLRGRVEWDGDVESPGIGRGRTRGWVAKLPEGWGLGGDLESQRIVLAGTNLLPPVEVLSPVFGGKVTWKFDLDRSGRLKGVVAGRLGAAKIYGFDLQRAVFETDVVPGSVTVTADCDGPSASGVRGKVEIGVGSGTWSATAEAQSADVQMVLQTLGLWKDPPKPIRLLDPRLREVTVTLKGTLGELGVTASGVDLHGARLALDLTHRTAQPDVAWRFEFAGLSPPDYGLEEEGSLTGTASFRGPAPERGTLDVSMGPSRIAGVAVNPFAARVEVSPEALGLEPAALSTSLGRLGVRGAYSGGALHLAGTVQTEDARALARWAGVHEGEGSLDATFTLDLSEAGLAVQTHARSEGFGWGDARARSLEADVRWDSATRKGDCRASATGLSYEGFELGEARMALSREGGRLEGDFATGLGEGRHVSGKVSGSASPEAGDLRLTEAHLQIIEGREFIQEGAARCTWTPSEVGLEGLRLVRGKKSASLSFTLGRTAQGAEGLPLSARFEAHGLPLNALPIPPGAGTVGGQIEADLRVTGTTAAPLLHGTAHVEDGFFRFANSDLEYRPITLELTGDGDELKITRAHITSPEGGEAAAVGWLRFKGLVPTELLLEGSGGDMPFVVGKEMVGRAQFYVKMYGNPASPRMEGIAKVTKGRIELPELSHQAPLPSTVHFVNAPKGSPLAGQAEGGGAGARRNITGRFQLDFEDVWVQSRLLLAQVEGRIVARLTETGPLLDGTVNVTEGRYLFMGKKFDLKDSKILFRGRPDNVPDLDVTARYEAPDYEVTARLTGSPERPVVDLSSKPPLEPSDVLAVIMFGKPLKDLEAGQKQNWSAAAVAMAAQYQASPLLDSGKLGLASLEVGVDDVTGAGTVGFSRYIGDKLVLEYKQVFGTLPEERLNMRYRINRRWSVEVDTSSIGSSGGDLVWEQRY